MVILPISYAFWRSRSLFPPFYLINPKFLVFSISSVISFFTDDRGNSDLESAYDSGKMTVTFSLRELNYRNGRRQVNNGRVNRMWLLETTSPPQKTMIIKVILRSSHGLQHSGNPHHVVSSELPLRNKAVYKSVNTIRYQFMKYWTKEKKDCFKDLYKTKWSYHPLIEDKCQYPYKKERTK